ncbi:lysylphosphatidylglycerol synthase transmembrane domain-containing protein [Natronomonas amylolytica]|uniref:lysylphosphatidylglycerol synthase transmembrane domain-containing protein n=1 Tax=Natronomonas amylolytica TaxID=3108498 RepID=UPI003008133F
MSKSVRSQAARIGRYLLGIAALIWVINRGDWNKTIDVLGEISPSVLGLLVALAISGVVFRSLMWYSIVDHTTEITLLTAIEIDLVVNFLNQLMPSRLSGRSAAPLVVRQRAGVNVGTAAGITGVNTGLYGLLYAGTALVGIAVIFGRISTGLLGLLLLSTALYLVAGVLILIAGLKMEIVDALVVRLSAPSRRIPIIGSRISELFDRVPEFTGYSADVFQETLTSPRVLLVFITGWIGSLAVFPALRVYVLFGALGSGFEPATALPVILIAAYSVTLLPLTPGGIGVTEATATFVFVALGVPYEIAASTVLVDRVLGVYIPALLGWYPTVRQNPLSFVSS